MATVSVYNAEGKKTGTLDLNDAVFGVKPKQSVVHQVYTALEANLREPWAHSKTRGEVRGGGKKPWRQKGTGRARHGSIRSPIWKGGGVTFGPRSVRNYSERINKKMKHAALKMSFSSKVAEDRLLVLESMPNDGKTKTFDALRKALPGHGKTTLVLQEKVDEKTGLSIRNIPRVHLQQAMDVNVADLMHHQYIITTKAAIDQIEKRLV